jgi:hypothetical protein
MCWRGEAWIVADRLVENLDRAGLVVMQKAGGTAPSRSGSERRTADNVIQH